MRQTLLVRDSWDQLLEYPTADRGCVLGKEYYPWYLPTKIYGYVLNRRPKFEHKYYTWALPR